MTRSSPSRSRTRTRRRRAKGWSGAVASTSGSSKSGVVTTSGSVTGQHDQGQVDLARRHLGHQLVRARLHHRQVDAGVAGVERHQRGRQRAGDEAGRGPDGQAPPGHARQGPRLGPGGLHVGQDPLHERQEGGAVGREGDRALARAPVEEDHAELVLEQADLARQRGLGQVQAGGGLREALLLGHGQGVGQLVAAASIRAYRSDLHALYVFDV